MAGSEDYLDSLLNSVTKKLDEVEEDYSKKKEENIESGRRGLPPKTMKALEEVRDLQFLREFESDSTMDSDDIDDFLADFEAEINGDIEKFTRDHKRDAKSRDDYMDQVDSILQSASSDDFDEFNLEADDSFFDGENVFGDEPDVDNAYQVNAENSAEEDELAALARSLDGGFGDASVVQAESGATDVESDVTSPAGDALTGAESESSVDGPPEGMEGLESLFAGMDDDLLDNEPQESASDEPATEEVAKAEEPEDVDINPADLFGDDETEATAADAAEGEVAVDGLSEGDELSDEDILSLLGEGGFDEMSGGEGDLGLDDITDSPENVSLAKEAIGGNSGKSEEEPKKVGFFQKILNLLFGEDDDEDADEIIPGASEYEGLSEDEIAAIKAMEGGSGKKEKKEKPKKEKKEKPKKEPKPKKPPKPKKEKPKKESGPKEKPLPKVPVILIVLVGVSIFVAVKLGTDFVAEDVNKSTYDNYYDNGDYCGAFATINKPEIKDADIDTYKRTRALASVQWELRAYYSMMRVKKYNLALDCLIRGLGRYELNNADAAEGEKPSVAMENLKSEIVMQLNDQFSVSEEQAKELYDIERREDYSVALNSILRELGLYE